MAHSKPSSNPAAHVESFLQQRVTPGQHLVLGLSGGMDSVVLLDMLCGLRATLGIELSALHVNHQISANAAGWARFCRNLCSARAVPLRVAKVNIASSAPEGLEAAARSARYAAYSSLKTHYMILAHHLDDQAETFMLQLLRGAGSKGLSSMPTARVETNGKCYLRPLLGVARSDLVAYALQRGLHWIEDESNADIARDRNFLRHRVLPLLQARFPAYRATLARSAAHQAEAQGLLDELAQLDADIVDGRFNLSALQNLSAARARNALRFYFSRLGVALPSTARLEEILRQVLGAQSGARPRIRLGNLEVRRFQNQLYLCPLPEDTPPLCLPWRGERRMAIAELGGVLSFRNARGEGINPQTLNAEPVTIRTRRGGERLQPDCRRPRRSLKNLLQESRIAPWQRYRLPLLYCGETLVYVPGIGVDCAYHTAAGEKGLVVEWKSRIEGRTPFPNGLLPSGR
ncbi:MAG: tRNA lysidine(34) synthetase TilS [Burkholderiales bacterium]